MIREGDTFTRKVKDGRREYVLTYRRETDDPAPTFECELMRVTHLSTSGALPFPPHTFGAEPQWWKERGLVPEEKTR